VKTIGRHVIAVMYPKVLSIFDKPYEADISLITWDGSWMPDGAYPVEVSWPETREWEGVLES
jgi:hypothetical protein